MGHQPIQGAIAAVVIHQRGRQSQQIFEEAQDAGRGLNIVGRLAKPQPLAALVAAVREAVQRSRPVKPVIHLTR